MPNPRGNTPVLEARNTFGRKTSRWIASDAVLLFEYIYQTTVVTDRRAKWIDPVFTPPKCSQSCKFWERGILRPLLRAV